MKKTFIIKELDCAHCAAKMEEKISKIDGVNGVSVNFLAQKMVIDAKDEVFEEVLQKAIKISKEIEPDCEIIV